MKTITWVSISVHVRKLSWKQTLLHNIKQLTSGHRKILANSLFWRWLWLQLKRNWLYNNTGNPIYSLLSVFLLSFCFSHPVFVDQRQATKIFCLPLCRVSYRICHQLRAYAYPLLIHDRPIQLVDIITPVSVMDWAVQSCYNNYNFN